MLYVKVDTVEESLDHLRIRNMGHPATGAHPRNDDLRRYGYEGFGRLAGTVLHNRSDGWAVLVRKVLEAMVPPAPTKFSFEALAAAEAEYERLERELVDKACEWYQLSSGRQHFHRLEYRGVSGDVLRFSCPIRDDEIDVEIPRDYFDG